MCIKKDSVPVVMAEQFMYFFLDHEYNENMFNSNGHINPKYNSFKKTGLIAKIFEDYWDSFYRDNKEKVDKYRSNANAEINKMIDCANKNLGCSVYECPKCEDIIFVGHTCKSRLCSSCGYKYKLERVENIMQTAYNVPHRQIVFTIPKEYRKYFFVDPRRIDIIFEAVNKTLDSILNITFKRNKDKKLKKYISKIKWMAGFFAFLHTFGRDLKWNPHIHVLIAELKISDTKVEKWNYFDYNALSKRFQKNLNDLMIKKIPEFTYEDAKNNYLNHKNGLYVYAEKKKFKTIKDGIEYICRYCGRCPISENRIISYKDGKVTFCYNAHEDDSYHEVTVTAYEFIELLLRHIIPKNYKIIRYFGFYRKKPKQHKKIQKVVNENKKTFRKQLLKYEMSIQKFFNRNPLYCPHCDVKMNYVVLIT